MLLKPIFEKFVQIGTLHVIDSLGQKYSFVGSTHGPEITIRFHNKNIEWKFLWNADIALGEGYTDQEYTIEQGTLADFLDLATANAALQPLGFINNAMEFLMRPFRTHHQQNPRSKSKQHIAFHYDLSGKLYDLFLDKDRQYSCAYFADPDDDLDTAQESKKRHLASKLRLQPGQEILDIGCGWGGLALYLAQHADVEVTGLTLSEEQLKIARERAQQLGLQDRVNFYLRDYREEKSTYDRIVSVGMFEHVGVPFYPKFFKQVYQLLAEDGVAVLHSISHSSVPYNRRGWINKYIFPGAHAPSLSEVVYPVESSKLFITDIEILHHHYEKTLHHWAARFQQQRDKARALYDERFCRMWEYYLVACEMAFRNLGYNVFQMQLVRNTSMAPLTRDYMVSWEQEERKKEALQRSMHENISF